MPIASAGARVLAWSQRLGLCPWRYSVFLNELKEKMEASGKNLQNFSKTVSAQTVYRLPLISSCTKFLSLCGRKKSSLGLAELLLGPRHGSTTIARSPRARLAEAALGASAVGGRYQWINKTLNCPILNICCHQNY